MRRTRVLAAHLAGAASNEASDARPKAASDTTIAGEVSARNRLRDGTILPFEPIVHGVADSLPGAFGIELTPEEIAQFKEQGWIVKRSLIPKGTLRPWADAAWDKVEGVVPFLDRRDPRTWLDPAKRWEITRNAPGERSQSPDGELSASSEWRWHHVGHDEGFLDATSSHPNVLHVVESIVGGPVRVPNRNRGIYCIFPRSDQASQGLPIQVRCPPAAVLCRHKQLTSDRLCGVLCRRSLGHTSMPHLPRSSVQSTSMMSAHTRAASR
jgi:hypothetical protein